MQAALPFYRQSRLGGVLRLTAEHGLRVVLLYAAIVLVVTAISVTVSCLNREPVYVTDIEVDSGLNFFMMVVAMSIYSGKETRHLASQATGRVILFAGALGKIIVMAAALTVGIALVYIVQAFVFALLSPERKDGALVVLYAVVRESRVYGLPAFFMLLGKLPGRMLGQALWLLQVGAISYFFFCCLRRWRAVTLCVLIGGGIALMAVIFIPTFRAVLTTAEQVSQGQTASILQFPQWINTLLDVANFILDRWPLFRALIACACLPLSYLVLSRAKLPR